MTIQELERQDGLQAQSQPEQEQVNVAGGIPGELSSIINWKLSEFVYKNGLGRVFGAQTDFRLPKTKTPRKPDVAFVSFEHLPVNTRHTVPVVPDLAVEVASKTDDLYDIEDKALYYLKAGVSVVWLVRPVTKVLEVYQSGRRTQFLTDEDEIDGGLVLPGFKLKVSDIFGQLRGGNSEDIEENET